MSGTDNQDYPEKYNELKLNSQIEMILKDQQLNDQLRYYTQALLKKVNNTKYKIIRVQFLEPIYAILLAKKKKDLVEIKNQEKILSEITSVLNWMEIIDKIIETVALSILVGIGGGLVGAVIGLYISIFIALATGTWPLLLAVSVGAAVLGGLMLLSQIDDAIDSYEDSYDPIERAITAFVNEASKDLDETTLELSSDIKKEVAKDVTYSKSGRFFELNPNNKVIEMDEITQKAIMQR
jgi:hypothetical protein